MKIFNLLLILLTTGGFSFAQTVSITVTENGQPMAYHNVTISHGDYILGSGQTNSNGFVAISAPNLRSKNIDVEGKYQSGGTKKEWSIKGKLKLDRKNSLHIRLEEIAEDIEKSKAEINQKMEDMKKRHKDIFGDDDDDDNFSTDDVDNNEAHQGGNEKRSNVSPSNSNFEQDLNEIKNTMSSFKKKDLALKLAKENALSTSQIKRVLAELTSSFNQKDFAIAAYKNCTDRENYQSVIDTFSSSFMRKDVKEATIGRGN